MCGLVDGKPFQVSADDISKFLGVLNEGDVTYLKNATSGMLFWKYFPPSEMDGKVLKSKVRYKNPVITRDLTHLIFSFWQIIASNVLH